jgi:hypothetical protein
MAENPVHSLFVQAIKIADGDVSIFAGLNILLMKSAFPVFFSLIVFNSVFSSCSQKDKPVICTKEFRTISITVKGEPLDEYFTIRIKTNDTIRIGRENVPGENIYPVLDDNFQKLIEGKTEEFRFIGYKNHEMVVNEPFVISADKCHINYVSGKLETEY